MPMAWGHGRDMSGVIRTVAVGCVAGLAHGSVEVPSAIVKRAVDGPVKLTPNGLVGDEHGDTAHGGVEKALCVYPWEHYPYWADELGIPLGAAAFGENLTTAGLLETEVFVGDTFSWGKATVQVSQPRRPCYKLGARHGVRDLPVRMERTGRTGFYLRVLQPGEVSAAEPLRLVDIDPFGLSVADVTSVMCSGPEAAGLTLERVLSAAHLLPARWVEQLARLGPGQVPAPDMQRLAGSAG